MLPTLPQTPCFVAISIYRLPLSIILVAQGKVEDLTPIPIILAFAKDARTHQGETGVDCIFPGKAVFLQTLDRAKRE
jgi:hypothetical protein